MTKLFDKAVAAASLLPEDEQDALASLILDEIASEREWQRRFTATPDTLSALARKAREHIANGTVLPYDPSDRPVE
ncbi:MAG TPA: hypothetical protein VEB23_11325 [Ramlibacter sp.]|nr:hypothetical protein [Ramlibacter sp.]